MIQSSRHLAKSINSIAKAGPKISDKIIPIVRYIQNRNFCIQIGFLIIIKIAIKMDASCIIGVFNKKEKIMNAPTEITLKGVINMDFKIVEKILATQKIPNLQPMNMNIAAIQINFNKVLLSDTSTIVKKYISLLSTVRDNINNIGVRLQRLIRNFFPKLNTHIDIIPRATKIGICKS